MKKLGGEARDAAEQVFLQAAGAPMSIKEAALKLGKSEVEVEASVRELLAETGLVKIDHEKTETYLHHSVYQGLKDRVADEVRKYFVANPERPLMPYSDIRAGFLKLGEAQTLKLIVDDLCLANVLFRKEAQVGLVGHEARMKPADEQIADKIEAVFQHARFAAPLEEEVQRTVGLNPSQFKHILDSLIRDGKVVRLGAKVTYHRDALEEAREAALGLIARHGSVTIAELRNRLNLSRKYAQAILEYFDKTGLTKRVEDRHVLIKKS
jgi:selenocysteine-specific elongation factor